MVDRIVEERLTYEEALEIMHTLNDTPNRKLIARSWYQNIERELYKDTSGNKIYGPYVIKVE